jgi:hypothetical protein
MEMKEKRAGVQEGIPLAGFGAAPRLTLPRAFFAYEAIEGRTHIGAVMLVAGADEPSRRRTLDRSFMKLASKQVAPRTKTSSLITEAADTELQPPNYSLICHAPRLFTRVLNRSR